jgi:hypothetical protein
MPEMEIIPDDEASQIATITRLTVELIRQREARQGLRRGVHAKGHGCVLATFEVNPSLRKDWQVGAFATPGRTYVAWVRFSNAAVDLGPDSPPGRGTPPGPRQHGSRGMAVKLLGVTGTPLTPGLGPLTQDFLMINQPVFSFANVSDYSVLTQVLRANDDDPARFFSERPAVPPVSPDTAAAVVARVRHTGEIFGKITSLTAPPAYERPPVSPLDAQYFSGAPFLLGEGRAMKFSARPVAPALSGTPAVDDDDYLRAALRERLAGGGAEAVVFDFLVQARSAEELGGHVATEIEDASVEWEKSEHPFEKVATITIPPQEFDSDERCAACEKLFFSPWNGLTEHRPLGGINRLRREVYLASARARGALPPL